MSPSLRLPLIALTRTSEYRSRPPSAVLVKYTRLELGVLSLPRAYPSRSSVVELLHRFDTNQPPLLPLARVQSMSRYSFPRRSRRPRRQAWSSSSAYFPPVSGLRRVLQPGSGTPLSSVKPLTVVDSFPSHLVSSASLRSASSGSVELLHEHPDVPGAPRSTRYDVQLAVRLG